jgi:hypothetical protein
MTTSNTQGGLFLKRSAGPARPRQGRPFAFTADRVYSAAARSLA